MEEIIIDSVNVAGCCCYENGKCLWTKRYYENNIVPACEKVKNCYYKQLQRLKKLYDELINRVCLENYERLEQENAELKEKLKVAEAFNLDLQNAEAEAVTECVKYRQALEEIKNNCVEMLITIAEEGKPNRSIVDTIWCKNIPCCTLFELIENTQRKINEVLDEKF